jgi:hypothetical protein
MNTPAERHRVRAIGGESVDAAEPPQIVFESPARCPDGHRAQGLLEQSLARARAPGAGWAVTMRVDAMGPGVLHAEGEIKDDHGAPVGHRVLERKASDCSGLARAIGVWATLVLDAEIHRPRNVSRAEEPSPPEADSAAKLGGADATAGTLRAASTGPDTQTTPAWPVPSADDKLDADRESAARRDEGRTIEIGAGAFLMSGTGGGLASGVTPFMLIEVDKGVFLRPALVFAQSLPSSGPDVSLVATRNDGCWRVTGLYTSRNGMQLDLCGGFDLGFVRATKTMPYLGIGPSLDLRGELGGNLAVLLRGLVDVNALQGQGDSLDNPLWAGRVELALSWRLR